MLQETQTKKIQHKIIPGDEFKFVGTQAFFLNRKGERMKLFHEPHENGSTAILKRLIEAGINIPDLKRIDRDEKGIYKFYEWWDGRNFEDLIRAHEITTEDYEKLGVFIAKVNTIDNAGFINYLPKNIVRRDDGSVFVCDHNKLIYSKLPENAIVRYVLTEDLTGDKQETFDLRTAFLKGYRSIRPLSLELTLRKQCKFIYGDEMVHLNPELFSEDPKYRAVKKGKQTLTLRFGKGVQAFMAMLEGAQYSYACDIHHVRSGPEIYKSSDYGKMIAYAHGFDGRDLHYKWVEVNSAHFIDHLNATFRKWDEIYLNDILEVIAPEHGERLNAYLEKCEKEGAKIL